MDPGNFLTDSGSKIPQLRPKTNVVPQKPALSATAPKVTNFAACTEASKAKIAGPSKVVNTKTPGLARSKTVIARPAVPSVAAQKGLKTPQIAVKRHASEPDISETPAPKLSRGVPKTGFPYKAKNWELKLRLAECEEWLTESRNKVNELEEEASSNADALSEYNHVKSCLVQKEQHCSQLEVNLREKTSAYDKLHGDSKKFLDTIAQFERDLELKEKHERELQGDLSKLREESLASSAELSKLRFSVEDLEFKFRRQKNTLEDLERSYDQCKSECADLHNKLREQQHINSELLLTIEKNQREASSKDTTIGTLKDNLVQERERVSCLEKNVEQKRQEIYELNNNLKLTKEELESTKNKVTGANADLEKAAEDLVVMRNRFCDGEKLRRYLHNQVQDLKGNIRVFCRVRPPLQSEKENCPLCTINFPDEGTIEVSKADPFENSNTLVASRPKFQKHEYNFDRVFHPNSTQEMVFEELAQLVQSALDGYNVCVFAYGQTGSGKTYTMEGPNTPEARGMIPRTVEHIFNSVKQLETIGWEYKVEVCFIEIYNEVLRDLLRSDKDGSNLKIMQVTNNDVVIPDLTVMEVKSYEDLDRLYILAHQNRVVASTCYNERSSRSHSVTKIKVTGMHKERGETCYGSLNLVDLAGSERLNEQTSTNDPRFREMKNINKSLSELGNVILALYQKNEHIPYRNSKLTHLLQPALGGSSKTLMLVNISPVESCMGETLCSLRFAQKVNQVKVGTSKKRIAYDNNAK